MASAKSLSFAEPWFSYLDNAHNTCRTVARTKRENVCDGGWHGLVLRLRQLLSGLREPRVAVSSTQRVHWGSWGQNWASDLETPGKVRRAASKSFPTPTSLSFWPKHEVVPAVLGIRKPARGTHQTEVGGREESACKLRVQSLGTGREGMRKRALRPHFHSGAGTGDGRDKDDPALDVRLTEGDTALLTGRNSCVKICWLCGRLETSSPKTLSRAV